MRIFTAILGTETNTFAPLPTGLAEFEPIEPKPGFKPEDIRHPFGMAVRAARERGLRDGHEVIAGRGGFATPGGTTTRRAYETLRDRLLDDLRGALPVDCVILGLHGAMIADGYDDAEGDLLAKVREIVGPDVTIGVELDPHGHLTAVKAKSADVIVFFKEYPHTDIYERAVETVDLTIATAEKRIRPKKSIVDLGMLSMFHTSREPMRNFVRRMSDLEGRDGVLSVSLIHGFPWGDCPELGTKILVMTDDRQAHGDALAKTLADEVKGFRDSLLADYRSADEVIDAALAVEGGPVVIADSADNPGGGSAGDSTFLLRRLAERGIGSVALGPLWDASAVALCFAAGEGAKLPLRIGGKTSPASGDPFDAQVEVLRCERDARMTNVFGRGGTSPLGDTAVVRTDGGIEIVLNAFRTQALGDVFTPLGVDWTAKKIVVVKSSQHFYAAYAPQAKDVLYAETPGSMTMNWKSLPYRKRPKLWPLD